MDVLRHWLVYDERDWQPGQAVVMRSEPPNRHGFRVEGPFVLESFVNQPPGAVGAIEKACDTIMPRDGSTVDGATIAAACEELWLAVHPKRGR